MDQLAALVWVPRQVAVRPLYVALAACALFVLPWIATTRLQAPPERVASADVHAPPVFVQFRLQTDASRVQLAGSFTNWEPRYDLQQAGPGVWSVTVPLDDGVHDYAFIVDGQEWRADPYAPHVSDGFGGTNSRLTLVRPEARQER